MRQFALKVSTIHLETAAQESYGHLPAASLKCQPCGKLIGVPAISGSSTSTFVSFRVLYSLYILRKLLDLTRRCCQRQTTGKGLCWVEFGTNLTLDSSSTRLGMSYRTYEPLQSASAGPKSHLIQKALTALHEMGAVRWRDRSCVQE